MKVHGSQVRGGARGRAAPRFDDYAVEFRRACGNLRKRIFRCTQGTSQARARPN